MIKPLEKAVAAVAEMPERAQEVAAEFLMSFANPHAGHYQLTEEQLAEVELAKHEVREGKVASDEEMDEVWRRFGL